MSSPSDRLSLLETFVHIADGGSISAAARELGVSQPTASRQLAVLEKRLKVQLVIRTTHAMTLTTAGTKLLAEARTMLDQWEALEESHSPEDDKPGGRLKVVAPVALGQKALARFAWQFQTDHPRITIDWILSDEVVRFSEVGCDCWIRVGDIPDEGLVVRPLGEVERFLVAAPELLEGHSFSTPKQMERLPLVALSPFEAGEIPLLKADHRRAFVKPPIRMSTNNIVALKEAALMGLGMAVLPRWFISEDLAAETLIPVIDGWYAPRLMVNVAYRSDRFQPRRLRTFLNRLTESFQKLPGIDEPLREHRSLSKENSE